MSFCLQKKRPDPKKIDDGETNEEERMCWKEETKEGRGQDEEKLRKRKEEEEGGREGG